MAIAFRQKAFSFSSSNPSSVNVGEPTGTASGDVLVCMVLIQTGKTATLPSGWTSLYSDTTNPSFNAYVGYIVRGGSAASTTFTFSGTGVYYEVHILGYSGVDNTTPIDAQSSAGTNSTGNFSPPSATPATTPTMALCGGATWNGSASGGYGAPAGWTIRTDNSFGNDASIAEKAISGTSTVTPGAWSNGSGNNWNGFTIILKQASAGGTTYNVSATLAEGVTIASSNALLAAATAALIESLSISDTTQLTAVSALTLTEAISAAITNSAIFASSLTLSQGLTIDIASALVGGGTTYSVSISPSLGVTVTPAANLVAGASASPSISLTLLAGNNLQAAAGIAPALGVVLSPSAKLIAVGSASLAIAPTISVGSTAIFNSALLLAQALSFVFDAPVLLTVRGVGPFVQWFSSTFKTVNYSGKSATATYSGTISVQK